MAAAEYPSGIIDTRDNIDIIETRDTTDVSRPVPFRRVIKRTALRKTKANNDRPSRTLFSIVNTRGPIEIIDIRGTIDVFHTAPFGIVDVLGALDLRDRTNL